MALEAPGITNPSVLPPIYNYGAPGVVTNITWAAIDKWATGVSNVWVTTGTCFETVPCYSRLHRRPDPQQEERETIPYESAPRSYLRDG